MPIERAGKATPVVVTGGPGFIGSHLVDRQLTVRARIVAPTRQAGVPAQVCHRGGDVEFGHGELLEPGVARRTWEHAEIEMLQDNQASQAGKIGAE